MQRGRYAASDQGRKDGITLLVPRGVIEAEQAELCSFLTGGRVQNLIVFLRRGGLVHLDVNERLTNGEHRGLAPLHVAVKHATSSVVSALLELSGCRTDVKTKKGETPLHLACK